nr:uncharacterized protein LOC105320789 [Crassostrea gigas]
MAPMRGLWVLLLVLYLDSANSQWGLSFGWFWGNLEDLKSSTVESGVVKSSSYIPGSRTKTSLFGNGDGSSSEEDSFAILSSIVDRQERNTPLRPRNGKGLGKKKRLRKYRKRNKALRRTQQYRKGLQAIRKKYNNHVRRKYSNRPYKEENKYTQQNREPIKYGSHTNPSTSQGRQKTTTLEDIVSGIHGSQGTINPTESGPQSSRPVPPGKQKSTTLEEIVNGNYDSQSSINPTEYGPQSNSHGTQKASTLEEIISGSHGIPSPSVIPGTQSNGQTILRSQPQGRNPNVIRKNSRNVSNRAGNIGTTSRGELEVEHGNETEATDAPESEGRTTLPTTTTTEFTTPEVEYEKEYYDGMDLFGFGPDPFYSNLGLSRGDNIYENGFTTPLTKTQQENRNSNAKTQSKGQTLNTQASPLKSNDVAAKDLETAPHSAHDSQNNKTVSNGSNNNIKDFKKGESSPASLPAVTEHASAHSTSAVHPQQNKNLSKDVDIHSQRSLSRKPQTVSIPKEAENRYLMKHGKVPHKQQQEKTDNQFNLHADHPQAWKSYDIVNPQQHLLTDSRSNIQSSKSVSSGPTNVKPTQYQMSDSSTPSIESQSLSKIAWKSSKGSDFTVGKNNGQKTNQEVNKEGITSFDKQFRNNQNVQTYNRVGSGRTNYIERNSFQTSGVQAHSPPAHGGKSSIHNNSIMKGNDQGTSLPLRGSDAGGGANNANPSPGDNITNGKNGKKINALFLTPAQKAKKNSEYSSKIEKTWVDGFLPDKNSINEQSVKGIDPSHKNIKGNEPGPKTINSLFSLTETASEDKNAQLQQYRKQSIASKPSVPPRVHSSEMHNSASSNTISVVPKVRNINDSKQNYISSNTQSKPNLDTAIKKRPMSTLSHMSSSVTAIPSHIPQSSWDRSVNDRMSHKYGKPILGGGKSATMADHHRKDSIKDIRRLNVDKTENIKVFDRIKQRGINTQESANGVHRIPTTSDTLIIPSKSRISIVADIKNDIHQSKPHKTSSFVENTSTKDQTKAQLNEAPLNTPQKVKPPNLISEGFPSRMNKVSSNNTAEETEIIPDIPGQGDVHIKLPEIPTRLTKALGQRDRTNSHQKSPPAPPVVVEQIQIPNKSTFSFPNSNKTQEAKSTSIDGTLANLQRPEETANKLKLTLLETEQKPHTRVAAPNAVKSNKRQETKKKIIQAQDIQLIPYSNAIPLDKIMRKQQNHFRKSPSIHSSTNMHGLGKRYDKPVNRHSKSNTIEKHPRNKADFNHKSSVTFRLTSAEVMNTPNKKERKRPLLTTNKFLNQNHMNSTKVHHKRTGGGRNIIPEMKFQINKKTPSGKITSPNAREYQSSPVKIEKITKHPKVSLLSKYQKKPMQKSELNAIVGIKRISPMGYNKQAANDKKYRQNHPNGLSNSNGLKKMVGSGRRFNIKPKAVVTDSPKKTTPVGENEFEQEMNGPANKVKPSGGLKTTFNPATENEIEVGGITTLRSSSSSTSPISVSGETESEGEEQTMTSKIQQTTEQSTSTQQDEMEYEYEYEYSTTTDVNGRMGSDRDPSVVGTAGDNIFSGSWKDAARQNAREIALEMEGTWTAVNASVIGRQNTCPSYKMRYQRNAVVFDTIDEQCRIIITWNKRQQREQVKEKLWWGINTYYRSRSVYVPVVTYVDLR